MNGLKFVRTQCNLSKNQLAKNIGVIRQTINKWENGENPIPEEKLRFLSEFFGLDEIFFGEIFDKQKQYLLEKAMFLWDEDGKETYRYKPKEGSDNPEDLWVYFLEEKELRLDEEYDLAQKRKKQTIDKIADIIKWTDNAGGLESQIACINRGCNVYDMVNQLMELTRSMKRNAKMPFFYEVVDVLKAMLLANSLLDEGQLAYTDNSTYYCGEDKEWIVKLAQEMKEHWEAKQTMQKKHLAEVGRKIEEKSMNTEKELELSVEEQIHRAEERCREHIEEKSEQDRGHGMMVHIENSKVNDMSEIFLNEEMWEKAKGFIKKEGKLSDMAYRTWIEPISLKNVEGNKVYLSLPLKTSYDRIVNEYGAIIQKAIEKATCKEIEVVYSVS